MLILAVRGRRLIARALMQPNPLLSGQIHGRPEAKMVDVVVIGSGAGGGVVAKELAVAGRSVVILERGPWLKATDFGHVETHDSWTSATGKTPFGPRPDEVRTVRPVENHPSRTVHPRDPLYGTLPAVVGGGTVYYGAMAWRFHPQTFQLRTHFGHIAGANLQDWPLTYADLEPYYEKAEYDLGVSGDANPFGPPRRRSLPLPPLQDNLEGGVLFPAARRLNWRPFHTPLAILSRPYRGRAACIHCGYCNGFGCEAGAKSSTLASVIPMALATGNCRLIPNAFVREITMDSRGAPNGVLYQTQGGSAWQKLAARQIVVACSATETPRLLLNSRSRFFPSGLGNRHDQVGRNIENDGSLFTYGLFEKVVTDHFGPGGTFSVDDFQFRGQAAQAGLASGILANYHVRPPLGFVQRVQPPADLKPYGGGLKAFYRRYYMRSIWLYATCHTYPRFENRVDVDPKVVDGRGVPVSRITYHQHPRNADEETFIVERCAELLREAGAHTVVKPKVVPETEMGISTHQLGSCRMGKDARTSVVDPDGRIHDVPNVYIADGSLLPNPGGANPSLTIQALAYHVAHRMLRA
jgi:choline dehydrogenase-like flavoprotein